MSAPRREVLEVRNAFRCYEDLLGFDQNSIGDILRAHGMMMDGIIPDSGCFRSVEVGVFSGGVPVHIASPARLVVPLMHDLMGWARTADVHPLVKGCVFHYEFEMIHPFVDGNGRTGRLWQNLILASWNGAMEVWRPMSASFAIRRGTTRPSRNPPMRRTRGRSWSSC